MVLKKPNFIYTFENREVSKEEEIEMQYKLVKLFFELELENYLKEIRNNQEFINNKCTKLLNNVCNDFKNLKS